MLPQISRIYQEKKKYILRVEMTDISWPSSESRFTIFFENLLFDANNNSE